MGVAWRAIDLPSRRPRRRVCLGTLERGKHGCLFRIRCGSRPGDFGLDALPFVSVDSAEMASVALAGCVRGNHLPAGFFGFAFVLACRTGSIAMQSTGQGGRQSSQPVQCAASTV